jgi:hypothetical protein
VLLLVHLQQRPQALDATLFILHTLSAFKLAYTSTVSGFHRGWLLVVICCLNVVGFFSCLLLGLVTNPEPRASAWLFPRPGALAALAVLLNILRVDEGP